MTGSLAMTYDELFEDYVWHYRVYEKINIPYSQVLYDSDIKVRHDKLAKFLLNDKN